MANREQLRLTLHGAIVLLVGLLSGLPTTVESIDSGARHWHTAHEALILAGVWMLASAALLPVLVFGKRELTALIWSLLAMGYGFAVALVIGGAASADVFEPGHTPVTFVAFLAAVAGIGGAVIAAGLTIMGARAALQSSN